MEEVKSSRVKVHSKLTVVSSRPTGTTDVHKFTALDHAMGLHRIHMIFYYKSNPFDQDPIDSNLNNLRVSLSALLCMYPPVTGRLTRGEDGNWVVKCNDAGVRMLKASVDTTIDEWLRSADATEEKDLSVWEDMPDDPSIWSPFRIQINDFEGGGLAIGLSCLHMHADPTSITLLIKSLTQVHRKLPVTHPPIFSLPSPTNTKSATHYATMAKQEQQISLKMASATFQFPSSVLKHRLSRVHDRCADATPFDLLAALFWSCVTRLKGASRDQKHSLSVCIDFRNRAKKTIPFGYFGNAVHFSALTLDREDLKGDDRLGNVALLVHQHVKDIKEEEFWSSMAWLESRKGKNNRQYPSPFRMYGAELTCVSMENMIDSQGNADDSLMYAAMFKKDEKPAHVTCRVENVEGEGVIMVMPSPEGGLGRTVMVTLPAEQVAKLCEDEAILEWEPTVLVTGGK